MGINNGTMIAFGTRFSSELDGLPIQVLFAGSCDTVCSLAFTSFYTMGRLLMSSQEITSTC